MEIKINEILSYGWNHKNEIDMEEKVSPYLKDITEQFLLGFWNCTNHPFGKFPDDIELSLSMIQHDGDIPLIHFKIDEENSKSILQILSIGNYSIDSDIKDYKYEETLSDGKVKMILDGYDEVEEIIGEFNYDKYEEDLLDELDEFKIIQLIIEEENPWVSLTIKVEMDEDIFVDLMSKK